MNVNHWFFSPFVVPLGAFAVAIAAIISGSINQAHARRLRFEQQMALLQRGLPIAEVEALTRMQRETPDEPLRDPLRSLANARRAASILISIGVGLILFFVALTWILGERAILCGAATGVIPLCIGIGFVFDYNLQKREQARFGLEVGLEIRDN